MPVAKQQDFLTYMVLDFICRNFSFSVILVNVVGKIQKRFISGETRNIFIMAAVKTCR